MMSTEFTAFCTELCMGLEVLYPCTKTWLHAYGIGGQEAVLPMHPSIYTYSYIYR